MFPDCLLVWYIFEAKNVDKGLLLVVVNSSGIDSGRGHEGIFYFCN